MSKKEIIKLLSEKYKSPYGHFFLTYEVLDEYVKLLKENKIKVPQ